MIAGDAENPGGMAPTFLVDRAALGRNFQGHASITAPRSIEGIRL